MSLGFSGISFNAKAHLPCRVRRKKSEATGPSANHAPTWNCCHNNLELKHANGESLQLLNQQIICCSNCTRLVAHREEIGIVRRRAYRTETYWSKPVPGFGDPEARLLIIGLAPGAHGANRTGRMFTGDRSGDFLYRALFESGFASQPISNSRDDKLRLQDAYITASARCAPPDNKPTPQELAACRPYLLRELELLGRVQVVVTLGGIATAGYLSVLHGKGLIRSRLSFKFGHGLEYQTHPGGPLLLTCYHPSQQNTSTRKLTGGMLREIFERARCFAR